MPKTQQQCKQLRDDMRNRILKMSSLYFARNGFADTKISDLAKHIGIGQGTLYLYFKSKEELFDAIRSSADNREEISQIRLLDCLPISAGEKIGKISEAICRYMAEDDNYCVKITLQTQLLLEKENMYEDDLYKELAKIIRQGQKEGSVIGGDAMYLADLYWGNVYLYALKKLFSKNISILKQETLNRLLDVR